MTAHLEQELARLRGRYDAQPAGRVFAPLADCCRRLGRLDEALELCRKGLLQHPKYTTAHVILGSVLRDRKEPKSALRVFEHVIKLDGMNLLARRECAVLAEELGEHRRAYEHWNRLLAADPDGQEAEAAIERLAGSPELTAPAEAMAIPEPAPQPTEPAVEESPAALEATLEEAESEPPVPEPAEEPPAAAEAAKVDTSDEALDDRGIATMTLARIYYEQGFKAKALDVYQRVLAEHPENSDLARRVETIRAELDQLESRAEDAGDILEDASAPATARPKEESAHGEEADLSREVDALTASIEAADSKREDYSQFRSWLSHVKDEDED